jgi:hypothetical protein
MPTAADDLRRSAMKDSCPYRSAIIDDTAELTVLREFVIESTIPCVGLIVAAQQPPCIILT